MQNYDHDTLQELYEIGRIRPTKLLKTPKQKRKAGSMFRTRSTGHLGSNHRSFHDRFGVFIRFLVFFSGSSWGSCFPSCWALVLRISSFTDSLERFTTPWHVMQIPSFDQHASLHAQRPQSPHWTRLERLNESLQISQRKKFSPARMSRSGGVPCSLTFLMLLLTRECRSEEPNSDMGHRTWEQVIEFSRSLVLPFHELPHDIFHPRQRLEITVP